MKNKAQGTIEPPKVASIGQGTIEYLIIIAIVVVIALVVVGLLTGFFSTGSGVTTTNQAISQQTQNIALTETALNQDGNYLLEIQSNETDYITINKITIDEEDQNYYTNNDLTLGTKALFIIPTTTICQEGTNKTAKTITLTYTTKNGITKTHTYNNVIVPCQNYQLTNTTNLAGTNPQNNNNQNEDNEEENEVDIIEFSNRIIVYDESQNESTAEINKIEIDSSGNIYIIGSVGNGEYDQFTANFPTSTGSIQLVKETGFHNNLFVAKVGLDGNFIWVRDSSGEAGRIEGSDIKVNQNGIFISANIICGGKYHFQNATGMSEVGAYFSSYSKGLIAKLSNDGEWVYVKEVATGGQTGNSMINAIAVDDEDIYAVGHTSGRYQFSGVTSNDGEETINVDLFIAKSSGSLDNQWNWVSRAVGSGDDKLLAADIKNGNLYLAGVSESPYLYLDVIERDPNHLEFDQRGLFVGKFNPNIGDNGRWTWAQESSNVSDNVGEDKSIDIVTGITGNDTVYITGTLLGANQGITFGDLEVNGTNNSFIAGIDGSDNHGSGSWSYAYSFGNHSRNLGAGSIRKDPSNNIYVFGYSSGSPTYTPQQISGVTINPQNIFSLKINQNSTSGISSAKTFDIFLANETTKSVVNADDIFIIGTISGTTSGLNNLIAKTSKN